MSDEQTQQAPVQEQPKPSKELVPVPEGWTHTTVLDGFRDNKDGSVTVKALSSITSPEGEEFVSERIIRLTKVKAEKPAANPTPAPQVEVAVAPQ